MPFTGEQKREYNKQAWAKKKQQAEEAASVMGEIDKYKALDEAKNEAPGEFDTWEDLWKIFNGLDPKADPDKKPKEGVEIINPSAHDILGNRISFDMWIQLRSFYRGDLWALMQLVGRGRWSEQAHKPLAEFFVKKNNTRLKRDYTQSQMSAVISSQDVQHKRLLLYPRGNRKSTVNLIDSLQWVINFPDIVVLICTNTKALGKKFVKELRNYFTVKDYKRPTQFQLLFPEFCIPEDKGKKSGDVREFWCPKAHLGLKDPTVSFTSMESGTAGVRADVIKFDDAVDEINYKNPDQRAVVREKYDATLELLVGNTGFWEAVGTRYTDGLRGDTPEGAEPDLYGTILKRNGESAHLKKLIAAAWTVLPDYADVPIKQLERHMVTLLFPTLPCVCGKEDNKEDAIECAACHELLEKSPGCFDSLIDKCKNNESFFRCQQLNEPAGELDDQESYINTFTEANIRKAEMPASWILQIRGTVKRYLFVDTAMTAGRKSDYSAFAIVQIEDRGEGIDPLIWYLEIRAGRYTDIQVAEIIAELMSKWNCGAYVEEIPGTSSTFKNEVKRQIMLRGCQELPFLWFTPSQEPAAKETRIRGLQLLHERCLIRIISGPWMDIVIKQLTDYLGHKNRKNFKGGRKDDVPDVMSYVYKVLPYIAGTMSEEQKKVYEELEKKQKQKAQYDRVFGMNPTAPKPPTSPEDNDPSRGMYGIPFAPRYSK